MSLEVEVGGIKLKTPMVGASGLWGFGDEYAEVIDLSLFGAIITKTITLRPREGNPPPRVVDLGHSVINSIGLENPGIDWFIGEKLGAVHVPCKLIVSIGGDSAEDYRMVASRLAGKEDIAALEVNISCPNVSKGGILFGRDPDATAAVIGAVRGEIDLPVIAKLPPLPGCIEDVAGAARDAGADALGVSNTLPSISIDIDGQRPRLGGRMGGLSGPPLKPVALYLVYRLAASAGIPVIGIGGIESPADAIEFILAGASAFEVGSVIFKWLNAPSDIIMGLEEYMDDRGYKAIEEFRGKALA